MSKLKGIFLNLRFDTIVLMLVIAWGTIGYSLTKNETSFHVANIIYLVLLAFFYTLFAIQKKMKNRVISNALSTQEGREALARALVANITPRKPPANTRSDVKSE